jgi:serine/threonine protein kinase
LADLGISASLDDPYTELLGMRDTRGTVTFMSPQQHEGEPPQVSDDIYALGATLYELLCGVPPFHTGDIQHQLQAVPPQPIEARLKEKQLPCDTPVPVQEMIMKCLNKDPAIRPVSVRALAQVIAPEVVTQPLFLTPTPTATPSAPAHIGQRASRGHFSKEFYIVMLVLGALLLIAIITLWMVLAK